MKEQPYVMGRDEARMLQDITAPQNVEIEIRADGAVLWVHTDGITALRACRIGNLIITDHRDRKLEIHKIERGQTPDDAEARRLMARGDVKGAERAFLDARRTAIDKLSGPQTSGKLMSFDEAEAAGHDGTGRDGHPDFPHRHGPQFMSVTEREETENQ